MKGKVNGFLDAINRQTPGVSLWVSICDAFVLLGYSPRV